MPVDFTLYLITDRKQITMPLPEAVQLALQGGVRAIQLRERDLPVRELLSLAMEVRRITREFNARLFINDRVDVAVAADADGVHLGHQSMPTSAVRKLVGAKMLIGTSTHTLEEARVAEAEGADLITFGPIYETPSKVKLGVPVGTEALRSVKKFVSIPIFALGGIRERNISDVMGAGAFGVSMISGIFGAEDMQRAAQNIVELIRSPQADLC